MDRILDFDKVLAYLLYLWQFLIILVRYLWIEVEKSGSLRHVTLDITFFKSKNHKTVWKHLHELKRWKLIKVYYFTTKSQLRSSSRKKSPFCLHTHPFHKAPEAGAALVCTTRPKNSVPTETQAQILRRKRLFALLLSNYAQLRVRRAIVEKTLELTWLAPTTLAFFRSSEYSVRMSPVLDVKPRVLPARPTPSPKSFCQGSTS